MQSEYEDQFRVESYLPFIDPIIAKWFNSTYSGLTDPQRRAIPLIHEGRNVLVSSPTGTGKTLTGFLSIINELFILSRKGEIRDQIYAVYISPLKALANDIDKNLKKPLEEIYAVARAEGMKLPEIRVGVRSGDTSQKDRQKMLRKPPHILITTPESLALILSSPKFSQNLASAKYLILDEIHEISSTKRGSFLSLNMERLADKVNGNLVRIGLSATQAPIGEIAAYLVGNRDGKVRDVKIIEVDAKKFLDLKTITPVPDLTAVSQDVANERMYDILTDLINSHKTTLIFTNTRSSTEHVAVRLKARGVESIEAHHSSLGKDTRLEVENKLKNGELKCVITSTSLELGIDIGYIDLVVQIGSPKSVSKGLQRIGRSGHNVNDMSKGRFVVFDLDDLVECAVLTRAAYERQIDRVTIPKNSLDVLSQCLVGMAIEKVWKIDDAYELIRRSYSYASLSREDFMNVLDYLAGEIAENTIFPKIWIDKKEGVFGKKKSARMIFFMNVGTIPDESDYQVISERGKHLGQLSDKFVERLKAGDVFVLGARTYIFLHTARNRVMVKEATGVKPTVPSWTGELLPRSYDLGILIGKFREKVTDMLSRGEDAVRFIIENYRVDASGAESIISYVKAQAKFAIPTGDYMLLEGYIDEDRNYCAIFHVPLGRRVNDALSRAYALSLANEFGINARVSITDDGFMLSYQKEIPLQKIVEMIRSENFVEMVRRSISNSEVLKQRFRHCASRSLMILRKYKGFDISVARQQLRSDRVMKALEEIGNFPVVTEAYREIMDDMMDVPRAEEFVRNVIENKRYRILGYSPEPSPFSHGIILSGVSDIVLMEDRARLLRELQSKILEKIYGSSSITFLVNDRDMAESYFRSKVPRIIDDESFDRFLRHFLFIDPFRNKVNSPFPYAETGITDIVERFINEDMMVSAFIRSPEYTHPDYYPILTSLFRQNITVDDLEKRIMDLLADNEMTLSEIIRATGVADNAVKDSLLRLETGYMIRRKIRNGSTAYALNRFDSKQVSQEEALEKAIEILVGSLGPLTFDEISIRLPVDRDMLAKSLRKMVEQKIMVFENITPVFAKQYILASDLSNLLNFSKLNIVASRTYNIMQKIQDEREYFSRFGFCFDQMSIMIRGGMVSDRFPGEGILYGRFIKHQWVYASLDLVQALHSLRYYDFNQNVLSVLEKIDEYGCTETDLVSSTGFDRKILRQILRELEYRLCITRDRSGRYVRLMGDRKPSDRISAFRMLVEKFGPVTEREMSSYFWFEIDEEMRKSVREIYQGGEKYLVTGDVKESSGSAAIIPLRDPAGIYFSRLYSMDSVNAVYTVNGMISGDLRFLQNEGIVWVDSVDIGDENVESFSSALIDFAASAGSSDIVMKSPVLPHDGWKVFPDMETAVHGEIELINDESVIVSKALFKPSTVNRKDHVYTRINNVLVGFRGWHDAMRFGIRQEDFNNYVESNLVMQFYGPFGVNAVATPETISIYRSIRGYKPNADEEKILRIIMDYDHVSEIEIRMYSGMQAKRVKQILDILYRNALVCKDSNRKIRFVGESMRTDEALKTMLDYLISTYGFVTVDLLKDVTGCNSDTLLRQAISEYPSLVKSVTNKMKVIFTPPFKDEFQEQRDSLVFNREFLYYYLRDFLPKDNQRGRGSYLFSKNGFSKPFTVQYNGRIAKVINAENSSVVHTAQSILQQCGYLVRGT